MVFFTSRSILTTGVSAGDLEEGAIVTLNENGAPVEFYVAKQDYEPDLNGSGRVLMVRKDCYDNRAWDSGNVNAYASSDIDAWFNGTYKNLLDADVQEAIGTTKFYYTPGILNFAVESLNRAIFSLSFTELGASNPSANTEGKIIPIFNQLKVAYISGIAVKQWTRSPYVGSRNDSFNLSATGTVDASSCNALCGSRPCFTLPSTFEFTADQIVS